MQHGLVIVDVTSTRTSGLKADHWPELHILTNPAAVTSTGERNTDHPPDLKGNVIRRVGQNLHCSTVHLSFTTLCWWFCQWVFRLVCSCAAAYAADWDARLLKGSNQCYSFHCPQVWWCVRYNTLENILLRCEFWNNKILVLVPKKYIFLELSFQNEMNNLSRLTVYSLTSINLACKSHTSLCFKPCLKGFVFLMCHNSSLSKYMFMLIYSPPFHPRFVCF